jgi:hypothetical protein
MKGHEGVAAQPRLEPCWGRPARLECSFVRARPAPDTSHPKCERKRARRVGSYTASSDGTVVG